MTDKAPVFHGHIIDKEGNLIGKMTAEQAVLRNIKVTRDDAERAVNSLRTEIANATGRLDVAESLLAGYDAVIAKLESK